MNKVVPIILSMSTLLVAAGCSSSGSTHSSHSGVMASHASYNAQAQGNCTTCGAGYQAVAHAHNNQVGSAIRHSHAGGLGGAGHSHSGYSAGYGYTVDAGVAASGNTIFSSGSGVVSAGTRTVAAASNGGGGASTLVKVAGALLIGGLIYNATKDDDDNGSNNNGGNNGGDCGSVGKPKCE